MATRVYTPPSTMERLLKAAEPLAILGMLLLAPALLLVVPSAEWLAVMVYLALIAVVALLLYRRGIKPVDPAFPTSLFVLALLAKLAGSLLRYWTVVDLYDFAADAPGYHQEGLYLAQYLRHFDFSVLATYKWRGEGSTQLAEITGLLYSVLPVSMAGAFLFFAMLAFAGSVFFHKAVCVARPGGRIDIYRLLVFFLPSILFWPASLGKDAWIFFNSGLVAWGWVSFSYRGRLAGLVTAAIGLLLIALIRPHISAFLALAMAAAFVLYGARHVRSPVAWIVGGAMIAGMAYYVLNAGTSFLGLEDLSLNSIEGFYQNLQQLTFDGGSKFTAVSALNPVGAIVGIVSSMIRPLPWEANNGQSLVASLETLIWLTLFWVQRRTVLSNLRHLRDNPLTSFALFYSMGWLMALTAVSNFGILARQRVAALPFLWMLLV